MLHLLHPCHIAQVVAAQLFPPLLNNPQSLPVALQVLPLLPPLSSHRIKRESWQRRGLTFKIFSKTYCKLILECLDSFGIVNSDLQAGIWLDNVAPSPIITTPLSLMV